MKPIPTYIQIAALAACLAAQFHPAADPGMPGTRKALQTLEAFANPANDRTSTPQMKASNVSRLK